jgi:hypothetical protein
MPVCIRGQTGKPTHSQYKSIGTAASVANTANAANMQIHHSSHAMLYPHAFTRTWFIALEPDSNWWIEA